MRRQRVAFLVVVATQMNIAKPLGHLPRGGHSNRGGSSCLELPKSPHLPLSCWPGSYGYLMRTELSPGDRKKVSRDSA